jgi:two-component system KDP operon response regulator KdpE
MSQDQQTRILLIDDEPSIRSMLKIALSASHYHVAESATGEDGLRQAGVYHPHLIILDLGLPDMGGLDVLNQLRRWTQIPVIVLTVKDDEATKVALLDAGADDYLTKPFGVPELLARIRVSLRHKDLIEATPTFQSGNLFVDLNQHAVLISGNPVKLTSTEFQLLACLVRSRGKVVSQAQLLEAIWGPRSLEQSHYLRIYIAQLRKKIEKDSSAPEHILTEPGVGYRIV